MVRFKLKLHPKTRTMYVPKELCEVLGETPEGVPNACSVVLYNPDEDSEKVIASLEIIIQYLKLRQK